MQHLLGAWIVRSMPIFNFYYCPTQKFAIVDKSKHVSAKNSKTFGVHQIAQKH